MFFLYQSELFFSETHFEYFLYDNIQKNQINIKTQLKNTLFDIDLILN